MARRKRKDPAAEFGSALAILVFLLVWMWSNSPIMAGIATGTVIAAIVLIQIAIQLRKAARLRQSGIHDVDKMDGRQFEFYLEQLFRSLGYSVKVTPRASDFGADLILSKDGKKITVQAKRYGKNVGISAVQEVFASKAHYGADEAWVVSNSEFTPAAVELAGSNGVRLIGRAELIEMMLKMNPNAISPKQVIDSVPRGPERCKRCGGQLVLRKGPRGEFWGCSNFPRCRYTVGIEIEH